MALEQRAIGRRIAELREERRLTQPVMADRVGVSLRGYQKWEAGVAAPNWRNLEQLAEALGVTADDLIGAGTARHEPVTVTLDRIETKLDQLLEMVLPATPPAEDLDDLAPPESVAPPIPEAGASTQRRRAARSKRRTG